MYGKLLLKHCTKKLLLAYIQLRKSLKVFASWTFPSFVSTEHSNKFVVCHDTATDIYRAQYDLAKQTIVGIPVGYEQTKIKCILYQEHLFLQHTFTEVSSDKSNTTDFQMCFNALSYIWHQKNLVTLLYIKSAKGAQSPPKPQ